MPETTPRSSKAPVSLRRNLCGARGCQRQRSQRFGPYRCKCGGVLARRSDGTSKSKPPLPQAQRLRTRCARLLLIACSTTPWIDRGTMGRSTSDRMINVRNETPFPFVLHICTYATPDDNRDTEQQPRRHVVHGERSARQVNRVNCLTFHT
jgi:hypothetical protein